jgi:hypothetical protein
VATRFVFHGDRKKAMMLKPEAVRQLFILRNAMKFQNLKQLQRFAFMTDGSKIFCSSIFGIENVHITASSSSSKKPVLKEAYFCWCNSVFAEGVVKEVIYDYEDFGPWWMDIDVDEPWKQYYPWYCQFDDEFEYDSYIRRYTGIRYRVLVCQGELGHDQEFICISSDFAGYVIGDKVIVLFMGRWPNGVPKNYVPPATFHQDRSDPSYLFDFKPCTCQYFDESDSMLLCEACMARHRIDQKETEADGSFIIVPIVVKGINA